METTYHKSVRIWTSSQPSTKDSTISTFHFPWIRTVSITQMKAKGNKTMLTIVIVRSCSSITFCKRIQIRMILLTLRTYLQATLYRQAFCRWLPKRSRTKTTLWGSLLIRGIKTLIVRVLRGKITFLSKLVVK